MEVRSKLKIASLARGEVAMTGCSCHLLGIWIVIANEVKQSFQELFFYLTKKTDD